MNIIKTIPELLEQVENLKSKGKTIGLVPTMGALHNGHISLFKHAKKEVDYVIGTIFINRIQFNNSEDFTKYPRTEEKDREMLEMANCDLLFMPDEDEIYQGMQHINVELGAIGEVMEAQYRPGHFDGVARIVYRFFSLIKPDIAFFGQKDLQQFKVIETMTRQLNLPVELKMCPIIREDDGLAMSSRNMRLSDEAREMAPKLFAALNYAGDLIEFGDSPDQVKSKVHKFIEKFPAFSLEYIEIADLETLMPVSVVKRGEKIALCIAAFLDGIRLIDNIIIIS